MFTRQRYFINVLVNESWDDIEQVDRCIGTSERAISCKHVWKKEVIVYSSEVFTRYVRVVRLFMNISVGYLRL